MRLLSKYCTRREPPGDSSSGSTRDEFGCGPQNHDRPACPWATSWSVRVQTRWKAGSAKLLDCNEPCAAAPEPCDRPTTAAASVSAAPTTLIRRLFMIPHSSSEPSRAVNESGWVGPWSTRRRGARPRERGPHRRARAAVRGLAPGPISARDSASAAPVCRYRIGALLRSGNTCPEYAQGSTVYPP